MPSEMPSAAARFRRKSLMRRGRGMRHEALGVAQIVRDIDQLQRLLQTERGVLAGDLERHDAAAAAHLRAGEFVLRMILAEGIEHAGDFLLAGQEIRDLRGVGAMGRHPQIERLEALQMHPGIERAHRRPGVAQEYLEMILEEILLTQNNAAQRSGPARRYIWSRNG